MNESIVRESESSNMGPSVGIYLEQKFGGIIPNLCAGIPFFFGYPENWRNSTLPNQGTRY